jgi:hypothetical protein
MHRPLFAMTVQERDEAMIKARAERGRKRAEPWGAPSKSSGAAKAEDDARTEAEDAVTRAEREKRAAETPPEARRHDRAAERVFGSPVDQKRRKLVLV